jgi:hypothetical protein
MKVLPFLSYAFHGLVSALKTRLAGDSRPPVGCFSGVFERQGSVHDVDE